jgi:hypothetical protein
VSFGPDALAKENSLFGFAPFGMVALGQLEPLLSPTPEGTTRLPLYTQATPPPTYPANYWKGTTNGQ